MYIVIFCSLLAILFTYLESVGKMKNGMRWGFILITLLAVIHYDYGNDYMSYYQTYREVTSLPFNLKVIMEGYYYREPGWTLLCFLFKYLGGFFAMVAVLNIVQNIIFYRFIRDNLQIEWRAMAVFIYVCSTNLYLMNFSMMRQGFAAAVFLALWPLIKQRKFIPVVVIMYIMSFIHSSAQFLIPIAFWGYIPFKNGKLTAFIYSALFVLIWFGSSFIDETLKNLMAIDAFEGFMETYGDETNTNTRGLGFILKTMPFFVALYYFLRNEVEEGNNNSICALGMGGLLLKPFASAIPLLGRFFVYFSVYSIVALPLCYKSIENKTLRIGLIGLFSLIVFYDYITFFSNPIWVDKFTEFHTIFEAI